jgi:glycosyltransferase involved in cell wall biosynthesis
MSMKPLVTIMIATKDRHEDLEVTVRDLRRQDYPNLELIVIDDASTPPVASIVNEQWPEARIVRHENNRGQNVRRNEGFRVADGKYLLCLDDDCSLVARDGISLSIEYMESNPHCAGIAYYVWNGKELPREFATSAVASGNVLSYPAGASFMRKAALEDTAGYRELFISAGEEQELSLQLLKLGWSLSFRPELVAHHRYSPRNRNKPVVWKWSLRNKLWTILIHCPMSRIPVEVGWKVIVGAWDAFRLQRGRLFLEALVETIAGFTQVWKLRNPLDRLSLRRYDALRAYGVLPYALFENPTAHKWTTVRRWANLWSNRLREGSFYSKKKNLGRGQFPTHEHELET